MALPALALVPLAADNHAAMAVLLLIALLALIAAAVGWSRQGPLKSPAHTGLT